MPRAGCSYRSALRVPSPCSKEANWSGGTACLRRSGLPDTPGAFSDSGPGGITVDAAGRVWVADPSNRRVMVFAPSGALASICALPWSRPFPTPRFVPPPNDVAAGPSGVWVGAGDMLVQLTGDLCDTAPPKWRQFSVRARKKSIAIKLRFDERVLARVTVARKVRGRYATVRSRVVEASPRASLNYGRGSAALRPAATASP